MRPEKLKEARRKFDDGAIGYDELKKVEDEAITELVGRLKEIGYHVITDGEFRRATWHLDFMWGFDGVGHVETKTGLPFHGEAAIISCWKDKIFKGTSICGTFQICKAV